MFWSHKCVNLFVYISCALLCCLNLFMVNNNLRLHTVTCGLEILHCSYTKAEWEIWVLGFVYARTEEPWST